MKRLGRCNPCKRRRVRAPRPVPPTPTCPDLAKLCPEEGKFFEILNVFGTDLTSGATHILVVDCNGCLTGDQFVDLAAVFAREIVAVIGDPTSGGPYTIRSFNPTEIPFSGTGSLAAATFIRDEFLCGEADSIQLNFVSGGGLITVTFDADGNPSFTTEAATFDAVIEGSELDEILSCFGLTTSDLAPGSPVQQVSTGLPTVLIPVSSLETVQNIVPNDACQAEFVSNFNALHPDTPLVGVFEVFSTETVNPEADAHARVFGGALGLTEDPISAAPNSALAAYAAQYEIFGPAPITIVVEQGAEVGRPGLVTVSATNEDDVITTTVGGPVFDVGDGKLNVQCGDPA